MIESILLKTKPREEKILINIYVCSLWCREKWWFCDAMNYEYTQYNTEWGFWNIMARAEIVKKANFVKSRARKNKLTFHWGSTHAKLTAKVLLKKGLSKIHKPPFKDFPQEFQDGVK